MMFPYGSVCDKTDPIPAVSDVASSLQTMERRHRTDVVAVFAVVNPAVNHRLVIMSSSLLLSEIQYCSGITVVRSRAGADQPGRALPSYMKLIGFKPGI